MDAGITSIVVDPTVNTPPSKKDLLTANDKERNVNTNTVTVNVPPGLGLTQTRNELGVVPQPLKIAVDSPTDWLAAVLTPLVRAIAAAYFTWTNQRSQIRSNVATFRHEWLEHLRATVVSYIGAAVEINLWCQNVPNFYNSNDAIPLITQMTTARATIRAMLDIKKPYTAELKQLMDGIVDQVDNPNNQAFQALLGAFTSKTQEVLESAWQDIRRDLYSGRK